MVTVASICHRQAVMNRPNIHIYPAPFTHQSRMLRITRSLADLGVFPRIVIFAMAGDGLSVREELDENREVIRIGTRWAPKGLGAFGKVLRCAEWQVRAILRICRMRPGCINCHQLWLLPMCVLAKWFCGSRLVYDTHELETETAQSRGLRRIAAKVIERLMIRAADAVVVVGPLIGEWYRNAYRIPRVHVVRNVAEAFRCAEQESRLLHRVCGLGDQNQIFLYQGAIEFGRGIGLLLEAFRRLPAHQNLVCLGYGSHTELVRDYARRYPNIHHVPAVPPDKLLSYSRSAHVGLAVIEDVSKSYYYCLPNKLFEYLQAGLPVIISDFPEMAAIIDQYRCGWKVRVSVEDIVQRVRSIDSDELAQKSEAVLTCRELFTWEREAVKLRDVYRQIFPTITYPDELTPAQGKAA